MAQSTSRICAVVGRNPLMVYEGRMERSYIQGKEFAAFLGVPYAAPPDGLERYQAPKSFSPITPHDQSLPIYKANVTWKISTQLKSPDFPGSSDCLYLNIFLPKHPDEIKTFLPVLVYIHGGGFIHGSNYADEYTPDCMVQHELVFVTINYRLGINGFLNTDWRECPGNAGLKDQVKALQWIQDNIACFMGDPGNVTLSGNSAGGTCVNLHLISPLSKNLFHKAIVQSGGIYCPWGFMGHQRERNQVLLNDAEFVRLLLAEDESKALQERALFLMHEYHEMYCPGSLSPIFGPAVETITEGAFISDDIEEMMKKVDHDKPVMAGIANAEGLYLFLMERPDLYYSAFTQNNSSFFQVLMDNFHWSAEMVEMFSHEIRERYFPDRPHRSTTHQDRCVANFFRDILFHRFYDNFKYGPRRKLPKNFFVYRFDHISRLSAVRRHDVTNVLDATHSDELKYLYTPRGLAEQMLEEPFYDIEEIKEVINHMCSLWANFCKNGVPHSDSDTNNITWRRHTEDKPCFLSINKDLKLIEEPLFEKEWRWLNARVNHKPNSKSFFPEIMGKLHQNYYTLQIKQ